MTGLEALTGDTVPSIATQLADQVQAKADALDAIATYRDPECPHYSHGHAADLDGRLDGCTCPDDDGAEWQTEQLDSFVLGIESTTRSGGVHDDGAIIGVEFSLCLGGPTVRAHITTQGYGWVGTLVGTWGMERAEGTMTPEAADMLAVWAGADQ